MHSLVIIDSLVKFELVSIIIEPKVGLRLVEITDNCLMARIILVKVSFKDNNFITKRCSSDIDFVVVHSLFEIEYHKFTLTVQTIAKVINIVE